MIFQLKYLPKIASNFACALEKKGGAGFTIILLFTNGLHGNEQDFMVHVLAGSSLLSLSNLPFFLDRLAGLIFSARARLCFSSSSSIFF
jgi:hypothetical protein